MGTIVHRASVSHRTMLTEWLSVVRGHNDQGAISTWAPFDGPQNGSQLFIAGPDGQPVHLLAPGNVDFVAAFKSKTIIYRPGFLFTG